MIIPPVVLVEMSEKERAKLVWVEIGMLVVLAAANILFFCLVK